MQLTLQDVSKFLDVSEPTITRWINQRGLPTQHVGGQYRFNRSEVLEWAAANQIKVSVELFDRSETEDEPIPTLTDALGRPIDGNDDGQHGGDYVATFSKSGVTIAAVESAHTSARTTTTAAAVDALLVRNELSGLKPALLSRAR